MTKLDIAHTLTSFLSRLFEDGAAVVPPYETPSRDDLLAATELLRKVHELAKLDAPNIAPELDVDSAVWAARVMHWGSYMLLGDAPNGGDKAEQILPKDLVSGKPVGAKAAEHWSVDLVFHFAPSLLDQCSRLEHCGGLHDTLSSLIGQWPLSAVGITDVVEPQRLDFVLGDDCLKLLYCDRLLSRPGNAGPSLAESDARIRRLVENAVGCYDELLPAQWRSENPGGDKSGES